MNPNALVHGEDGKSCSGSNTILRYLATTRRRGKLYPSRPGAAGR